jgi:hypothetical protein
MDALESGTHERGFPSVLTGWPMQRFRNASLVRFGVRCCLATALVVCLACLAFGFNFPPLTGRVVDQAGVMTTQSRSDLEAKLKNLEDKSGIQLVVA